VDFGVSKAVRTREETDSNWQRLTRTGAVLGTPLFMSPEQASGSEDIDARADLWASALILYECLTGELPFRGSNYLGVISQILNKDALPPSALRPELGIPAAVDRVVMHGLEKDRARRYQHMAEFERDMDSLLAGNMDVVLGETTDGGPAPAPHGRRRWPWHFAVAAVFALGIGTAVMLARTGKQLSRPAEASVVPAPVVPIAKVNPPPPQVPNVAQVPKVPQVSNVPKVSQPVVAAPPALTPPRSGSLLERFRHVGRSRPAHPASTAEEAISPSAKKSKADDKVAPSPYNSPKVP
jgi:hypothetical protein